MNKQRSKSKHPIKTKHHKIIWPAIVLISLVALATILWFLPSQPDPERVKFKTLRDDMRHMTKQSGDIARWSDVDSECRYTSTVGLQSGGWYCEVVVTGTITASTQGGGAAVQALRNKMLASGYFENRWVNGGNASLLHQSSTGSVICDVDFREERASVSISCGDASNKAWYQPAVQYRYDSLYPGNDAWKRLDG